MSSPTKAVKQVSMWTHALLMLLAAPLIWGLMSGIFSGFSPPTSLSFMVIKFAEWFGSALLALIVGWIALLFRKPQVSWALLLALIVFSAYSVRYTERRLGITKGQASAIPELPTRQEKLHAKKSTLVVTSVVQSSYGATAADINPDFVSMIEGHFVEEGKKHYEVAMKNMGYPNESIDYDFGTTLFNEGGERLAVTTLKPVNKGGAITKVAWWIVGGEIKRVVCVDTAGNEVPIRFGKCASKISETFGYKNWALDSKAP